VERIAMLRRQFAEELGIIIPPVRLRDNLNLAPSSYRLQLLGSEIGTGAVKPGMLMALRSTEAAPELDGEPSLDPTFGTPAYWIRARERELSEALGYTVVDPTTVLVTHLGEQVRQHAHELLGRGELSHLLEVYSRSDAKTVDELVPNLLTLADVLKVMRNLLREGVSVRDLRTILETLLETAPSTRDPEQLTEITRQRLGRQITAPFVGSDGAISAIVLGPEVDQLLLRSLRDLADGAAAAFDPAHARALAANLEQVVQREQGVGRTPVVVTRAELRRFVKTLADQRSVPVAVVSFREVEPSVTIKPVAKVTL